jgi:hypothetical protein
MPAAAAADLKASRKGWFGMELSEAPLLSAFATLLKAFAKV